MTKYYIQFCGEPVTLCLYFEESSEAEAIEYAKYLVREFGPRNQIMTKIALFQTENRKRIGLYTASMRMHINNSSEKD